MFFVSFSGVAFSRPANFRSWCENFKNLDAPTQEFIIQLYQQMGYSSIQGYPPGTTVPRTTDFNCALIDEGLDKAAKRDYLFRFALFAPMNFAPLKDAGELKRIGLDCKSKQPFQLKFEHFTAVENVEEIWLDNYEDSKCTINSLDSLQHASKSLRKLSIIRFGPMDLRPFQKMGRLEKLELPGNQLSNVSSLFAQISLQELDVSNNNLFDISPLLSLVNLRVLRLSGNSKVSDIWAVQHMVNLKELNVEECNVGDISALTRLTWLQIFEAHKNQIKSLGPVSGLTRLRTLNVGRNLIADIAPIKKLKSLKMVNIHFNKLKRVIEPLEGLKDMNPDVGLNVTGNPLEDKDLYKDYPNVVIFPVDEMDK